MCYTYDKSKGGIPESFKVGWYLPQKTGSSHLKRLELLSAAPLLCSPNFPRAQYLDMRTLTRELMA